MLLISKSRAIRQFLAVCRRKQAVSIRPQAKKILNLLSQLLTLLLPKHSVSWSCSLAFQSSQQGLLFGVGLSYTFSVTRISAGCTAQPGFKMKLISRYSILSAKDSQAICATITTRRYAQYTGIKEQ